MDQQEENVPFEQLSAEDAPQAVRDKAKELQQSGQPRHEVMVEQDRTYVLIALGERNTGGYRLETERVVRRGDKITVHAKEIVPPKNGFVAQVITYPLTIVALDPDRPYDEIEVKLSGASSPSAPVD